MIKTSPHPSDARLVDRAARSALREVAIKLPDLLLDGLPFRPALWFIVVEPLAPRSVTDGGIEVVEVSKEAESYQQTIGRVLRAGPASMEGKTTSGIELCNFLPDIRTPEALIGKFFFYQRHVGMELRLRKTDQVVRVMKVTDLLGETSDPHAWKFYI